MFLSRDKNLGLLQKPKILIPKELQTKARFQTLESPCKLTGVSVFYFKKCIKIQLELYQNKERLIRSTFADCISIDLHRSVRVLEDDYPPILINYGLISNSYPFLSDISWVIGTMGAGRTHVYIYNNHSSRFKSIRRNSEFCFNGTKNFFKNNDTFITETFLNERRSVFPFGENPLRYKHFLRSYPLRPNGRKRKHWAWGEGFKKCSRSNQVI